MSRVCMIAHLSSCAFFFVGATSNDLYDGMSWISDQGLNNATLGEKYVMSLYFAFTTMATVGYGDILPISHLEVAYVIFYMLVGASVFGYIIGSMSSLVDQMQTKSTTAKEKMNRVKDYMKERRLPKPLCNRIRRYFEFYMSQKEIADESAFLDDLSDDLQCCTPGEYIFYEGEYGRHMYFLVKGTVEVVINAGTSKEIICKVLTEGSFFGELAMLLSSKRCASVRAKTFGILYVLSRNGMERIRTHYPDISNQITREIRSKLQKIKADTLAQPNAGQMAGHIPDEENFTKEMEKPIRESITMIDRALSTLMGYYGDGEKGKRRSIACVIQHLKKFEFAHRDEIGHATDSTKLQPPRITASKHVRGNPRESLARATTKVTNVNKFLRSIDAYRHPKSHRTATAPTVHAPGGYI
ncbi:unnamed protein product [Aphanomyces euteiches]